MAEDKTTTPSDAATPPNNDVPTANNPSSNPSSFLAPSDFLPKLPPSTETPPTSLSSGGTPAGDAPAHDAPPVVLKAHVDGHGRAQNLRSCVTCRKRKVKCDKRHPCSNCNRAHIECIFPAPGRAPRKTRKPLDGRDKELLERLRRLEGVVKGMGVEVPSGKDDQEEKDDGDGEPDQPETNRTNEPNVTNNAVQDSEEDFQRKTKLVDHRGSFENRFGRLVINEGKSRYINNSFWANLSNEVEDLKGILNQSSDEDDNLAPSPGSNAPPVPSTHHGFVFGFSSQNANLLNLHPLPGQVSEYWDIFKDRVDPLVKVLHIPTLEPTIFSAASHLSSLSRGFECLLFALYYAVTTSLSAHDCLIKLGEEKTVLLARYRFAIEQALARANFLTTEEVVVLQAFVLFLICLRRNNDARVIWTLTGLVVRIAQTIGIHRDGSHFGLSPFEVEMRRRLWWQVCILDTRASEDHGCDPTIIEQSFDTKMPLNINDLDITTEMKEFPPERQGCTDMSFCLLRFEVSNTFRRLNYIPPGPPKACNEFFSSVTLQDKERWITECHQRLEDRYLKHCDMSIPLFWVTATVARLMMSKMWLMVYHPFQRMNGGVSLSEGVREKLFITSLENMEYSLLLETEARTMKWGWLFRTYVQWHALAYTLSELRYRTTGDMVDRAWAAVEKTRDGRWGAQVTEEINTGHLWRPLKKLYRKAKEARRRGLLEEQQRSNSNPTLRTYSPNENPMFSRPDRSRMTSAPLSTAQLRRFKDGPTFGKAPLDKHKLLRSPKLSESGGDDPMDTAGLTVDLQQQQQQQQQQPLSQKVSGLPAEGSTETNVDPAFCLSTDCLPATAPQTQGLQEAPLFSQNYLSYTGSINYGDMGADNVPNTTQQRQQTNDDGTMWMNSADSLNDTDLSGVMDTSGDLNWENWDQLVRQFGTDIDAGMGTSGGSGGGRPGGGSATNWNGSSWEMGSNGQNLRMGMGMGGGDWF